MSSALIRSPWLLLVAASLALSVALLAAACGDDGDGGGRTPAAGITPTEAAEPVSFDVSMGDNFFQPNEFEVSPGQEVTFNITNDGAAIHNMRVDGGDGVYNDTGDDTVSDPGLFNARDSGTLEWTAPVTPGPINFRCDFHPDVSTGTITVE